MCTNREIRQRRGGPKPELLRARSVNNRGKGAVRNGKEVSLMTGVAG